MLEVDQNLVDVISMWPWQCGIVYYDYLVLEVT
jgi:hypothetical protein